ncbi:hypothetical protein C0Q70_08169 [Pomacea canaliculata]|uniref:Uncharacterized protein n=2 Tax=Pomacea canaliculata TaxID=400727 RepID=A0A2T7PH26_POMCA|nr:hypothetical protein C0Q70_08169 [Pomacea canaliculata]
MSGEATPPGSGGERICEGLRLMQHNLKMLSQLKQRQERVMAEALQLQQDMLDFRNSFNQEIARILEQAPLKIRPRKVKVDLDAMETDATAANLPSPLQPQPAQANVVEATLASVASHSSELLSAGCENVENLAAEPPPADAQLASFPLPQTPQHVDVVALDSGTSKREQQPQWNWHLSHLQAP